MTEPISEKKTRLDKLITHRFHLPEFKKAIETFKSSKTGKVCIVRD